MEDEGDGGSLGVGCWTAELQEPSEGGGHAVEEGGLGSDPKSLVDLHSSGGGGGGEDGCVMRLDEKNTKT